ncbi:MAG: type II and III secretion system protein [Desulfopila sp.]
MMPIQRILLYSGLFLCIAALTGCNKQQTESSPEAGQGQSSQQQAAQAKPAFNKTTQGPISSSLPVRYQTPSYMVDASPDRELVTEAEASLKVGASIRSTRGPQPLWDILKRLAAMKSMNVSWASDVDQNVLVDVDISADDDFYKAIDNLLRQVDYFHEMKGNTIVVKYKETRQFHVAMPFVSQQFKTGTGGNVLGNSETSSNIDGTISLKSGEMTFDLWKNIEENINQILDVWTTETVSQEDPAAASTDNRAIAQGDGTEGTTNAVTATRRRSNNKNSYLIDKSIGMVTATAPRPLLDRLQTYFDTLRQELYKQITIEAKIIEVQLTEESNIGINWSEVLKNFPVMGTVEFGANGQVYPDTARFVSRVNIDPVSFTAFINALKEQGDTKILSNPKISVMNGQPALITVGRNITYVDAIESDYDSDTNETKYTVKTQRILSGVGMALNATILNNKEIIMNLVPVTSELEEPIEYLDVGSYGGTVGLPVVNIREMSTTVKVLDGEMLVIGGLISNTDDNKSAFAPGIGSIPILKYLFGYESKVAHKRELIILLRPQII